MLHLAVFADVAFHELHVFAHDLELGIVEVRDFGRIGLGPTDEHGVRVFERRTLGGGGDAVLDLHKEHVADDAEPFGRDLQAELGIVEVDVGPQFACLVCRGSRKVHVAGLVHARTCPVP